PRSGRSPHRVTIHEVERRPRGTADGRGASMTGTKPITTPFKWETTAAEVVAGIDLAGSRVIVTGGASGIGAETARALATTGAEVTLAVRDTDAGQRVAAEIEATTGNTHILVAPVDLADPASGAPPHSRPPGGPASSRSAPEPTYARRWSSTTSISSSAPTSRGTPTRNRRPPTCFSRWRRPGAGQATASPSTPCSRA